MNIPRISSYFNKVEDKYVFRVSTAFWHFLIGLLTLASIVGIVMFLWSVIPPGKADVKAAEYPAKPTYPPVEKVSLADLHLTEEKVQPIVNNIDTMPVYKPREEVQTVYDPNKPAYDLALAELRKIIPDVQWKPGKYEITNQTGWELYHSDQYRRWVPTGSSMEDYLDNIYRIVTVKNYSEKKKALDAVTKIVKAAPANNKGKPIEYISSSINSNWQDLKLLDSICTIIAGSLKTFNDKNSANAIQDIIRFIFNYPNVAFDFVPFAVKTCSQLSDSLRTQVLLLLTSSYYNYFHENIEVQKEATEQFIELLPQLHGFAPARALKKFYSVYNEKNKQRSEDIARMLSDYDAQVNTIVADSIRQALQNEYNFRKAQEDKSNLRWRSLQTIGGGLIAIALLGTILTLLSIQRILKRIEGAAENKSLNTTA